MLNTNITSCYMHVRMYACTHVRMYVRMYAHMYEYLCMYVWLYYILCLLGKVSIVTHNWLCMCVCVCSRKGIVEGCLRAPRSMDRYMIAMDTAIKVPLDGVGYVWMRGLILNQQFVFLVGDVMRSEQNNGGSSCLEGRLHTTAY